MTGNIQPVTDLFETSEQQTLNDMIMAKNVAEALEKAYPGWSWAVNIDHGLVNVRSMKLSGMWGFTFHIREITGDMRNVIRAGGEILERYNRPRGKFDPYRWTVPGVPDK